MDMHSDMRTVCVCVCWRAFCIQYTLTWGERLQRKRERLFIYTLTHGNNLWYSAGKLALVNLVRRKSWQTGIPQKSWCMLCLLSVRTIRAFESRCACVESKEPKANNKNNHNCPSPCRIFKSNQKWQHLVHGGTWLLWSLLVSGSYSNTKVQNTKTASLLGLEMSRVIDLLSNAVHICWSWACIFDGIYVPCIYSHARL